MARDAECSESGGEAQAAAPCLPPGARRGAEARGHDGWPVGVDHGGALKEADGRQGRVVGGAQHGAFHHRRGARPCVRAWASAPPRASIRGVSRHHLRRQKWHDSSSFVLAAPFLSVEVEPVVRLDDDHSPTVYGFPP